MTVTTERDPLAGMRPAQRAEFDKAPKALREAYAAWWVARPDPASAHRDTWPAYAAGWRNAKASASKRA